MDELGLSLVFGTREEEEEEEEGERCSDEPLVQLSLLPPGVPWSTGNGNLDPSSGSGFYANRVSSIATKEAEEEGEVERASSRASDDEENVGAARKKLRLSKEQSASLEESFKEHNTLNPKEKVALAEQLNLMPRQVEVWFQNRRARTKLKQTETDCERLKRRCEALTEENRWLRKELSELRALKTPSHPQLPATTLSMCPSCERTTVAATTVTAATDTSASEERSTSGRNVGTPANSLAATFGKRQPHSFVSHPATSTAS